LLASLRTSQQTSQQTSQIGFADPAGTPGSASPADPAGTPRDLRAASSCADGCSGDLRCGPTPFASLGAGPPRRQAHAPSSPACRCTSRAGVTDGADQAAQLVV